MSGTGSASPRKRGMLQSISGKMLALILGCMVVAAVVAVSYLMYFRTQLVQSRSSDLAASLQAQIDTQIEGKLNILLTNAISLTHNGRVIEALQKNEYAIAEKELKQIIKKFETADFKGTGLHLIRANMTSFWRSFDSKRDDDISGRALIKKVATENRPAWGVEIGKVGVGLRAVAPVQDESGTLVGMVETTFGVGSISRFMEKEKAFYILLVDKGVVDADAYRQKTSDVEIGGRYLTANKKWFDEATVAFAKSGEYATLQQGGTQLNDRYFLSAVPAKDMAGKVYGLHLTGMTRAEYDKQIKPVFRLANNLLIAIALMGVITAVIILVMLKRVVMQPLAAMVTVAADLAHGEGNLTARLNLQRSDEIGEVSGYIDSFIARVQQSVTTAKETATETAVASQELSHIAANLSNTVEQQAGIVAQSDALAQEVGQNLDLTEEMAINTTETIEETRVVMVAFANKLNSAGEVIVGEAHKQQELAGRMHELAGNAGKIRDVLEIISDIADQTNLLALNASIEAARAGELGRGFAVVADEVRQLAAKTQSSLSQINQSVTGVVNGVERLYGETEQSSQRMVEIAGSTSELISTAGGSGERLAAAVQTSSDLVKKATFIATRTKQLMEQMEEINQVAVQNRSVANEVEEVSNALALKSDGLRENLGRFKC